jgi:hypothetical protein
VACGEIRIIRPGRAVKEGLAQVTLTGDKNAITKVAADNKVDPEGRDHPRADKGKAWPWPSPGSARARPISDEGPADSSVYIRAIIDRKGPLPPGRLLSVTAFRCPPGRSHHLRGRGRDPGPDLE